MTHENAAALTFCSWDRLLGFVRRKFPKIGMYGGEQGGDAIALVGVLQNSDEMARIARELSSIDSAYTAAVKPLYDKIEKANKDRSDAERALLETVSAPHWSATT